MKVEKREVDDLRAEITRLRAVIASPEVHRDVVADEVADAYAAIVLELGDVRREVERLNERLREVDHANLEVTCCTLDRHGFHARGCRAGLAQLAADVPEVRTKAEEYTRWNSPPVAGSEERGNYQRLKVAGDALAAAALRGATEYDREHRALGAYCLRLAVADWSKVDADEGGRAPAPPVAQEPERADDREDWLREYERRKLALLEVTVAYNQEDNRAQGGVGSHSAVVSEAEVERAERALDEWVDSRAPRSA